MLHISPLLAATTSVVERGVVTETAAIGADVGVAEDAKVDVDDEASGTDETVAKGEGFFRTQSLSEPIGVEFVLDPSEGRLLVFLYATATATPRQNPMNKCRFVHPDDFEISFFCGNTMLLQTISPFAWSFLFGCGFCKESRLVFLFPTAHSGAS